MKQHIHLRITFAATRHTATQVQVFSLYVTTTTIHNTSTTHIQKRNIFCFTSWAPVKTDVNTGFAAEVGGRVEHGVTDYKLPRVQPLLFSSVRPLLLATERQVSASSNTTFLPVHTLTLATHVNPNTVDTEHRYSSMT